MPLVVRRNEGETWRECVIRYAKPHGLQRECLECFASDVLAGADEAQAAFDALYEWDCTDFEPEPR